MKSTPETLTPYDTADYLSDVGDVAAYLEAALDEGGGARGPEAVLVHSASSPVPGISVSSPAASG